MINGQTTEKEEVARGTGRQPADGGRQTERQLGRRKEERPLSALLRKT